MIGREVGETTTRKVGETTTMRGRVGETTAQGMDKIVAEAGVGETTALKDKVGETTAQDMDKIVAEAGVGETTPLMKAGGTLVKTGEGVARGPLVMEGPLQANP